jgi:hypothetical protein
LQHEDWSGDSTHTNASAEPSALGSKQLPDRCQFTFSDGRQCTMARSDIHPSLCRFHAEREDQLFGSPAPGGNVVGRALDLPELHSACRDLTTAAGVNRALGQVFRLLAQRRISRQEAATFGHLAQLLLRSISLMRQENLTIPVGSSGSAAKGYPPAGESHGHQELSPVHKVELSPPNKVTAASDNGARSDETDNVILSESALADESKDLSASSPVNKVEPERGTCSERSPQEGNGASGRHPAPCSEPLAGPTAVKTSSGMNRCADFVCNSREISTYENAEFKAVQNEQLQKRGVGSQPESRLSSGKKHGNHVAFGLRFPQIMGAGYEYMDQAMRGQFLWRTLLVLALLKVLATSLSISSGAPGGMFAPALFVGAWWARPWEPCSISSFPARQVRWVPGGASAARICIVHKYYNLRPKELRQSIY